MPAPRARTAEPPWKVGELARRTGLSVRALHHYHAIGLLSPSHRTPTGHRLYDRADVERLQQVQSLRGMGIPLDEVKRLLDGAALSPRRVIALHLERVRAEIARQTRIARRLAAIGTHMDATRIVSTDELCRLIEEMSRMDQFFTPEQLDVLRERREAVGEARAQAVQAEWAEIIPAVQAAMDRGADPGSPEVVSLARRWKALVHEFTGGDPKLADAVRRMYESEAPAIRARLGKSVPTPAMFPYIQRAWAADAG
jgi:DNA-binding transcriptional MerR regulator